MKNLKPLFWIKYERPSIWQRMWSWVRRFLGLRDPGVATGDIPFLSGEGEKPDNGIIDITTPPDNEHTFGEIVDKINRWGKI